MKHFLLLFLTSAAVIAQTNVPTVRTNIVAVTNKSRASALTMEQRQEAAKKRVAELDTQIAKIESDYAKLSAQWDEAAKREKMLNDTGAHSKFNSPEALGARMKISENFLHQLSVLKLQRYDIQQAYHLLPPTAPEKKKTP